MDDIGHAGRLVDRQVVEERDTAAGSAYVLSAGSVEDDCARPGRELPSADDPVTANRERLRARGEGATADVLEESAKRLVLAERHRADRTDKKVVEGARIRRSADGLRGSVEEDRAS